MGLVRVGMSRQIWVSRGKSVVLLALGLLLLDDTSFSVPPHSDVDVVSSNQVRN